MTDDEMIDLFDALQPILQSRLSDLSYGYIEGLFDGGELEAAILMGVRSAASENAPLPMDLVLRAAPMYTAGDNRALYVDAAAKLAGLERPRGDTCLSVPMGCVSNGGNRSLKCFKRW